MLFVWIFLIFGVFFIIGLVDFVLRNPMFVETFVIKIGIPFTQIEYTKEHVEFIYIIAASILLGALVIAVSTWVLDARRKLKVRSLRKELKSLQKAIKEAQTSLPQQEEKNAGKSADVAEMKEPSNSSSASISPEDITKSFEDTVAGGDFLENPLEKGEAEKENSDVQTAENDKDSDDGEKRLPQVTAIEAEVVDSEEPAAEDESAPERNSEEKKTSDRT